MGASRLISAVVIYVENLIKWNTKGKDVKTENKLGGNITLGRTGGNMGFRPDTSVQTVIMHTYSSSQRCTANLKGLLTRSR